MKTTIKFLNDLLQKLNNNQPQNVTPVILPLHLPHQSVFQKKQRS
jgi:hypothetical protein